MTLITITLTFDTETKKTEVINHDAPETFEITVDKHINQEGFVMQIGDYTFGKKIDGYHYNHLYIPLKIHIFDEQNLLRKKKYEEYLKGFKK